MAETVRASDGTTPSPVPRRISEYDEEQMKRIYREWFMLCALALPAACVFLGNCCNLLVLTPKLVPRGEYSSLHEMSLLPLLRATVLFFVLATLDCVLRLNILAAYNYALSKSDNEERVTGCEILLALPALWKDYLITAVCSSFFTYGSLVLIWMTSIMSFYLEQQAGNYWLSKSVVLLVSYMITAVMVLATVFIGTYSIPALSALDHCSCGMKTFNSIRFSLQNLCKVAYEVANYASRMSYLLEEFE